MNIEQISFHDSTVVGFTGNSHCIELTIEDTLISDSNKDIILRISNFDSFLVNEQEGVPSMETEEGEILDLLLIDDCIVLIIEWNDYISKRSHIKKYKIKGGNVSISPV
jgi:hypothetical protein